MAVGTTLGQLVQLFRDEAGMASTAAMSQNTLEAIKTTLRRTQDVLYTDWDWPHLRIERDEALQEKERYYSFPPDLDHMRIEACYCREDAESDWQAVNYGISFGMRNDSDAEQGDTRDPVEAWQYYEDGQYEVWPMPDTNNGVLRFVGIRKCPPLVADADRAVLDDRLIVLYAAGQWLQRQKDPSAQIVLNLAEAHFRRIKGNSQRAKVWPSASIPQRWVPITVKAPGT
ncbi:hypothetical protein IB275_30520 [Pseudomonas sp. PDM21]|uniref:phage adaptor protein n=1 Tax=Pseudomonas sp. PDM21 TaxID=2769257 RepID=UPI001782271E|nr:hypothetical protein [Pseudomonas sp. PDM21]MBD9674951.1 hypothetical protein [Pseudomonas sp. PDM21]